MKLVQRVICGGFFLTSIAGVAVHTQTPQPTPTYRTGLKSIAIPSPNTELVETGPDYRVLLELLAPNQNRLIAGFLLSDELKLLTTSKTSLSRYALAETSRSAEFATVTPEIFKQLTDAMS